MSKSTVNFIKPLIRAFKIAVYNKETAWFRLPIRGKMNFGLPSLVHDVDVKQLTHEHIPYGVFTPKSPKLDSLIMFIHGGGFSVCSYKMYNHLLKAIASESKQIIYALDYRLAPEYPFPAGLEDCYNFYSFLKLKHPDTKIIVGGDSAGGGLVFSLVLKLQASNQILPSRIFAFSPWADLTISSKSYDRQAKLYPLIDKKSAEVWAKRYLAGEAPTNILASPVLADLKNFPPVFIHVGKDEALLDDSRKLFQKLSAQHCVLNYKEWDGMIHVFQIMYPFLEEARESIAELLKFIDEDNL